MHIRPVLASTALLAFTVMPVASAVSLPHSAVAKSQHGALPGSCQQVGCMPTEAECAKGQAAPVTLGVHITSATVCANVAGETVYAGGDPSYLCAGAMAGPATTAPSFNSNDCEQQLDAPLDYQVVVPKQGTTTDLPTLYFLSGSNEKASYVVNDDGWQLQQAADRYHLAVVAIGGQASWYVNWADGSLNAETQFLKIVHQVQHQYGTARGRLHTAIGGYSMGGYGAMLLAERHPDLFGNVLSFSGFADIEQPLAKALLVGLWHGEDHWSEPTPLNRLWGDPIRDDANWQAENPAQHPCGLGKDYVWMSAGDGVLSPDEATAAEVHPTRALIVSGSPTERAVRFGSDDLAAAMERVGIAYTYVTHPGVHDISIWNQEFEGLLPDLARRLHAGFIAPQRAVKGC